MTNQEAAEFFLTHGSEYPYANGFVPSDWAERAALAIASDLCDRRGIKWEMGKVDEDVRVELIRQHAAIIRAAAAANGKGAADV